MNRKTAKSIALLLISIFGASHTFAQRGAAQKQEIRQEQIKKIQAAKWSFIIYRLNLTEERSNKLLPIYQSYEAELRNISRPVSFQRYMQNRKNMNDALADSLLTQRMENAQKVLDLKAKYKPQFLTVLTPGELLELQMAEQEFVSKIMMQRKTLRQANQNKGSNWDDK